MDPKKTIKIGGRLVTGQYGGGAHILYGGTESHVDEILENICNANSLREHDTISVEDGRERLSKSGKNFEGAMSSSSSSSYSI